MSDNKKVKILVCDDDLTARILMKETLASDSIEVIEAENGQRAIEQFEKYSPALLLLDVSMPKMNGFEVCEHIRGHEKGKHIPVIMVTGSDDLESIHKSYAVGATDFIAKPIKWPILGERVKYILRASQAFADLVTQQQELHQLAFYDSLTGLPNRQYLMQDLQRFLAMAERNNYQAAMLFIDLDRFKRINDTMGHSYGDKLLRKVAHRLQANLRDSDTFARVGSEQSSQEPQLSSFGGDEFTIFLSRLNDPNEAMLVAERVIRSFSTPFQLEQFEVVVTPSIGISMFPNDGDNAETLLKNADTAMYFAKQSGRCCYKFYQDSMNAKAAARLQLEQDLRRALKSDEIVPFYQPQICAQSGRIVGVEALVRWLPAKGGIIPPDEFIPIAEETGLINELGRLVLERGCYQAKQWFDEGNPVRMAINVSAHQFRQLDFTQVVADVLQQCGLAPELLELELTESVIMSDAEENIARLIELKALGISLAVDDFGTGYSSLSYLKRFPIDILKIDRSFMCDVNSAPDDLAIVEAILALAESLKLGVIAEGIEYGSQIAILKNTNQLLLQGYLFSRPVAAEYISPLLNQDFNHLMPAL
ncbi:EAL domain-containing protein [Paraglaciecola agarilytica]|uniref:two-component system response regulator n=1 Tax=Paraglaciecola chathamensis TaxID=368405 RepID=UPI001C09845E|nr:MULTISPECIES: EAL domain-containing protein [Paraglaciecola]MBU3017126.1 EAL domain-containing protein [Paraglaciecola agarilytica]MDO6840669.1 EAL domain-containing protein [Paraglaciecola chathamensis]